MSAHIKRNKDVRARLAGGNEALDAVDLLHQIRTRAAPHTEAWKIAGLALDRLKAIADAMRERSAADAIAANALKVGGLEQPPPLPASAMEIYREIAEFRGSSLADAMVLCATLGIDTLEGRPINPKLLRYS